MPKKNGLETNKIDIAVSGLKGIIGLVPCIGPMAAEVIGNIIPNQRNDRIVEYLEILNKKVESQEQNLSILNELINNPKFIDLFEDSLFQAVRSLSKERLNYIANILVKSISLTEIDYNHTKRFLSLLGQIVDIEIILLGSYVEGFDYREKHWEILKPNQLSLAAKREEIEHFEIIESYKNHLALLGLLEPVYSIANKIQHDDLKSELKLSHYNITLIGKKFFSFIQGCHSAW